MKNIKYITLYVIDNDITNLNNFTNNFSFDNNYTLCTFSSVQDFISNLRENKNNDFKIVLITDIVTSRGMNTKSAIEVLPIIKNIDKKIPVIIITDHDNIELKMTSSDIKPAAYIKRDRLLYLKLEPILNRIISEYHLKESLFLGKITLSISTILIAAILIFFLINVLINS